MAEVTCPQCRTRQPIEPDATGYRCITCAASWRFVRCTVCGERFHTRPGARAWTCPRCGTPHGRTRGGTSRVGAPIAPILVAVVAIGVIGAAALLLRGGDDDRAVSPTPTSPTSAAPAADDACDVISSQMQVFRVDQLGRAATALAEDASRLRSEGARTRAAAVDGVVDAIHGYQEVAEGGGDTRSATDELLAALDLVDWC